ncbi:MAG TPA: hypothetical protein VGO22_17155 [Pseudorhizobium sp.]|nr:hypothetical protein [Pseudorhizobium sp.]
MKEEEPCYRAVEEDDGSWSVIDTETGLAATLDGDPLVLLGQEFAKAFAAFMNLDPGFRKEPTLH